MKKEFNLSTLPNGLQLLLVPRNSSPTTTVAVVVKVGSKYESKEINGISHFLEHMAFKGTKKRPNPSNIAKELDSLGASYNAFTSHEFTTFYTKAENKSSAKILEIISDLYINPIFEEKEIEKEKGVVIEEINMYEDIPMRKVQENFMKLLYGNQPAGWDIAGKKEVIKRLTRSDLINYRKTHYSARNTLLVISGGFSSYSLKRQASRLFGDLKRGRRNKVPPVKERQNKPAKLIEYKKSDQTHLVVGFRAFNIFDKRRFALEVLTTILGKGMSSRLFRRVRDELGAAYYVGSSAELFSNHGFVAAHAGANNKKAKEVIKVILEEFEKLKKEKVEKEEIQKAKNHIIGHIMLGLETSDDLAYFYASQIAIGIKPLTPKELVKKINSVTAEEIQNVANSLFKNKSLNLAVLGPFKESGLGDILKIS